MKKSTTRQNSIITNKPNLEELYTFKNFPVFIGCTEKDFSDDPVLIKLPLSTGTGGIP